MPEYDDAVPSTSSCIDQSESTATEKIEAPGAIQGIHLAGWFTCSCNLAGVVFGAVKTRPLPGRQKICIVETVYARSERCRWAETLRASWAQGVHTSKQLMKAQACLAPGVLRVHGGNRNP